MRLEHNDDILHLREPKVAFFMTGPLRRLVVQQLHGHGNLEWVGENAFAVAVPVTWLRPQKRKVFRGGGGGGVLSNYLTAPVKTQHSSLSQASQRSPRWAFCGPSPMEASSAS